METDTVDYLASIVKPCPTQLCIIEACGICLNLELNERHNKQFKALPRKSIYGTTISKLQADSDDPIWCLRELDINTISNKTAYNLFSKMLSKDFDLDKAKKISLLLYDIGKELETINACLHDDVKRLPLVQKNIMVIFDGDRLSFKALENALRFRKHGHIYIVYLTDIKNKPILLPQYQPEYVINQMEKICRDLYYLKEENYSVLRRDLDGEDTQTVIDDISSEYSIHLIASGWYDINHKNTLSMGQISKALVPNNSVIRLICNVYTASVLPEQMSHKRKFLVPASTISTYHNSLRTAIELMLPGDELIVLHVYDGQNTNKDIELEPDLKEVEKLQTCLEEECSKLGIKYEVILKERDSIKTVQYYIEQIIQDQSCSFVVLKRNTDANLVDMCMEACRCPIILTDYDVLEPATTLLRESEYLDSEYYGSDEEEENSELSELPDAA